MSAPYDPRNPSPGAATPQPGPYQQPAPQPAYYPYPPPQPYGPPPGYAYPAPYGAYGAYGYYPQVYATQPDRSKSTIAGVFWILCLIRDLLFLLYLVTIGSFMGAMGFGFGGLFGGMLLVMALFPLMGAIGSGLAMAADFQHKNYGMGTAGAIMGLVGSSFPGIVLVGPAGLILSLIALILHVSAKSDFATP